ncbi:hypothetical protein BDV96DRAFT_611322 [Lophiotrema nucula]|uniref:ABM domain-containing protein n=1 Tax=Lophiotrema nucula TaxID=690887 RepID=A0A6A5ZDF8_9PLEO|nr:hypothetical protein BDV96DRAFT_611322 [Lophiotrema nucula]
MPILEVTLLQLKGVPASDPTLLVTLSNVRGKLQTDSRFYNSIEDPTKIYILGIWPSLEAHHQFLNSPARVEVLGPQEGLLEFVWTVHMEMDAMSSLPLDAPVLAIAGLFIKADSTDAFEQKVARHRHTIVDATKPYNVVNGWRCDPEPGKHESLMFTGWADAQAHAAFIAKAREDRDYADVRRYYEDMEVRHARNLEAKDS